MSFYYSSSSYSNWLSSWSWWGEHDRDHDYDKGDWCYTSVAPIATDDPGSSQNTVFLGKESGNQSVSDWKAEGVTITATDINGNETHASLIGCDGIGVDAGCDKTGQLEYNKYTGKSESISINFENVMNEATVGLTKLGANEGGHWEAYYNGNLVSSGDFLGDSCGSKEINIDTGDLVFDTLVFTASDTYYGNSCEISDYLIQYISASGPQMPDEAFTVQENGSLGIAFSTLLSNDSDEDTDLTDLTLADFTNPTNGTITYDEANELFTYEPGTAYDYLATGEVATDTFTYAIKDPDGNVSNYATVTITIIGENDAPVAVDDTAVGNEDAAVNLTVAELLSNDTDVDGDTLTVTSVSNPVNGTVVLNDDGTITFTPDADFVGAATFEYTVSDGNGGEDTATVTVDFAAVNDGPAAGADSVDAVEDTALTIQPETLLGNDVDPDGDVLTIVEVSNPTNGTVTLNPDGTITFTPDPDYSGPATFEYTVSDGNGGTDTATVTVNVAEANDAPEAANDSFTGEEDTPYVMSASDLLGNDSDPEGDTLTISSVDNPTNGTVVLNADGTVTFTPDADFTGEATFEYTITDGNGGEDTATVTIDFTPVNDGPSAAADLLSGEEDTPLVINPAELLGNDTDADGDALTITSVSNPTNGTVTLNDDGTITFTPDADYNGEATFEYTITDGNGGEDTATVTIEFAPVNDAPVAGDDVLEGTEDTTLTIQPGQLLGNDTDVDGDTLTITEVSNPTNGTVTLNDDGTIDFTPDADYSGPATFEYTVSDGNGGTDTATVTINVADVNEGPDAVNDVLSGVEDTPLVINPAELLGNDTDADGDTLTITSVSNPSHGTVALNNDGTITFTPNADYNGEATFEYTITDGNGEEDTATVTIDFAPVNDAPVAGDDVLEGTEDTTLTIQPGQLLGNDTDVDGDTLTITEVSNPTNGTVTLNDDGTIDFTPDADYSGPATFEYTVSDGNGGTDTATVTINVANVNEGPDAVNDVLSGVEDTPLVINPAELLGNDTDADGDTLTITSVSNPSHGTVTLNNDGTITFTPNADYNGEATFEYTITDGNGGEDTATVTIDFAPVNDAPVANDDVLEGTEDTTLTIQPDQLLGNDTDVDGDTLTITDVSNPTNGTVTLNDDGTIDFTPDADYSGPATFEYTVSDGNGGTDTGTVTIDVQPTNDGPDAVNDVLTGEEDTPLVINPAELLGNDTDPDGDTLTITSVSNPTNGTVTLNNDGTITFTPDADYNGEATFEYTITDGNGGEDTATVTIDFAPVNDGPDAVNDVFSGEEDTPITIAPTDLLSNDTDPEGDTLTITAVGNPSNGTVVLNDDGTVTFTPAEDFTGEATFEYTITDGNGGYDTATVTVDFSPVNDGPDANDDTFTTNEDTPLVLNPAQLLGNDTDPEGDDLSIVSVGNPRNGTVYMNANGTVTFVPAPDFFGEATFEYTITDGNGGYDTAEVTVNVTSVNDVPCAKDDMFNAEVDQALTFPTQAIVGNDRDDDGDTLSIYMVSNAQNGTATLNDDGTVSFEPTTGFVGTATFDYLVTDGNGGYDTATVSINYGPTEGQIIFGDDNDNILIGGNGDDQIYGCDGDDIIYAGQGSDYVDGGAGNDTIYLGDDLVTDTVVINEEDMNGTDTIYDFGDEDTLDLGDLLSGVDSENLDDYLHIKYEDGDTIIEIDKEGQFANNGTEDGHADNVDHTVIFADTQIGCGCTGDQVVIDYLIQNNQLVTEWS
jgi:CshA-type fibril repeat protein/VCBS repeat-containing protein